MQPPFDAESPHLGELTSLVSRAVEIDARIHALQAQRAVVFAEAHDLAEREGTRPLGDAAVSDDAVGGSVADGLLAGDGSPGGVAFGPASTARIPYGTVARRDRAHRVIRAELAAALHVSEWTIGSDIAHAVDALTRFPTLHAAQARGEVSEKHVRGAVDAGRIISHQTSMLAGSTLVDDAGTPLQGDAVEAEIARRYAWLDEELLPHAQALTPALLVPVAKRLAEKVAGASFDDRHRLAKRDRRVTLTDLDDGMCQLTALVTSFEGHAIFDRLTQYAKQLQASDIADSKSGSPGNGSSSTGGTGGSFGVSTNAGSSIGSDGTDGTDDRNTENPSTSTGAGSTCTADSTGTGTDTGTRAGAGASANVPGSTIDPAGTKAEAEAFKRPLGEARTDSLVALLIEGVLADPDVATTDSTAASNTDAAGGYSGGIPDSGARKKLGPRVTARVQVLVPVSLTGRLDTGAQANIPPGSTTGTGTSTGDREPSDLVTDGAFQPELIGVGPLDTDTAARIMHDTPTWDMIVVTDGTGDTEGATTGVTNASDGTNGDTDNYTGISDSESKGTSTDCPNCSNTANSNTLGMGSDSSSSFGVGSGIDTTGDILTVDGYRVPAHLRRFLAARDQRCRFPGCTLPVYRCDIDHTIAAEDGGPTASTNLGNLCRGHHTMKHHGGLHPTQNPRGEFTWTLPSGRQYVTPPPSKVAFSTALTRPNIPRLIDENRKRYPFGMTHWDDPLNPPDCPPEKLGPVRRRQQTQHGRSDPSGGPPPF